MDIDGAGWNGVDAGRRVSGFGKGWLPFDFLTSAKYRLLYKQINDKLYLSMTTSPLVGSRRLFISFLGLGLIAALPGLAAEQEDFIATQDAFVRSARFADENFNATLLHLAGRAGENNRKVYLQFELPQDAEKATHAVLRLTPRSTIEDDKGLSSTFSFLIFASTDNATSPWGETEITWNNAPGNTTADPTKADSPWVEVGRAEVKLPLPSTEQPLEIPLPTLPAQIKKNSGRTLTLILVPDEESRAIPGVGFFSKEGTGKNEKKPTLVLSH